MVPERVPEQIQVISSFSLDRLSMNLIGIRALSCQTIFVLGKIERSHRFTRAHYDPTIMLSVGVGARGRRHRYTYGTSRIRPTVAKDTRVVSRK